MHTLICVKCKTYIISYHFISKAIDSLKILMIYMYRYVNIYYWYLIINIEIFITFEVLLLLFFRGSIQLVPERHKRTDLSGRPEHVCVPVRLSVLLGRPGDGQQEIFLHSDVSGRRADAEVNHTSAKPHQPRRLA